MRYGRTPLLSAVKLNAVVWGTDILLSWMKRRDDQTDNDSPGGQKSFSLLLHGAGLFFNLSGNLNPGPVLNAEKQLIHYFFGLQFLGSDYPRFFLLSPIALVPISV